MSKRCVLITGANKGIGLATVAAVLNHQPDTHVFLGSRNQRRGVAARLQLIESDPKFSERVEVVAIDVTSDASAQAAAQHIEGRLKALGAVLYGVVNNAGIGLGEESMATVLNVNTHGPRRVAEALLPLLVRPGGRVVNVSSASGPNFLAKCDANQVQRVTNAAVTWEDVEMVMSECLALSSGDGKFEAAGFGDGSAYGLSKACLNAYTIELARREPTLIINACTPGFIETDLTRGYSERSGKTPAEMGMKSPAQGTRAALHLLFGAPGGSGWYFGSDAERSPLDRYRSPGSEPYVGPEHA